VVSQLNADITDALQLRDVAMATIFVFLYMGCTYVARWCNGKTFGLAISRSRVQILLEGRGNAA